MQLFNRSRHLLSKHTNTSSFSTTPFPFFKSSAAEWLSENLPSSGDLHSHQATHKRFPDDAQYRIEIPSTEGLESLKSVIEEAKKYKDPEQFETWVASQPKQLEQFNMMILENQLIEKLENDLKSKNKVIKFSELANK